MNCALMSYSLNDPCNQEVQLFRNAVSEQDLINALNDPPLAYEDRLFLPLPSAAVSSTEQLMRYIDQPVNFFESIVNN